MLHLPNNFVVLLLRDHALVHEPVKLLLRVQPELKSESVFPAYLHLLNQSIGHQRGIQRLRLDTVKLAVWRADQAARQRSRPVL